MGILDPLDIIRQRMQQASNKYKTEAGGMPADVNTNPSTAGVMNTAWDSIKNVFGDPRAITKSENTIGGPAGYRPFSYDNAVTTKLGNGSSVNSSPNPAFDSTGINNNYANATNSIKSVGTDNSNVLNEILAQVKANYANANKDVYGQYMDSRDKLTGAANNLGVNLDTSKMGTNWDAALRRMQEMSDSNLNSDTSYLDKMGLLNQQSLGDILTALETDKLSAIERAKAAAAASYSGSGGSGGKDSANSTSTSKNVGDLATYNELLKTNPAAAKLFYNSYADSVADPEKAWSLLVQNSSAPQNSIVNKALGVLPFIGNSMKNRAITNQTNAYKDAINAMLGISGILGNNNTTQKVTIK